MLEELKNIMLALTNAAFALTLGYILDLPLVFFIFGSLFPELDQVLTFAAPKLQEGLLHTPIAAITIYLLIYLISARKHSSLAFLGGYFASLFLDALTTKGVMWFFPLTAKFSLNLFQEQSLVGNLIVSGLSFSFLVLWIYLEDVISWISNLKK